MPERNPNELARHALAAWTQHDEVAWHVIAAGPLPDFDAVTFTPQDRVIGLFFQGNSPKSDIAAVIRGPDAPGGAVWFRLRRVADGFVVIGVVVGETPLMVDWVEG